MRALGYLFLLATVALSALNAMPFSPLYDSVAYFLYLFTRGSASVRPDVLAHLTSLFMGLLTLLLAGIPAAIYERIRGNSKGQGGMIRKNDYVHIWWRDQRNKNNDHD